MDPIVEIAQKHNLAIIEDACQAHGTTYKGRPIGSFGTACFSLYATKNITTVEGYFETDLSAAIGLVQMDKLEQWNTTRRSNAAFLTAGLSKVKGVTTPPIRKDSSHVFHQYTIRITDRDNAARKLRDKGVGVGIHYPTPIHQQPLYRNLGYSDVLPVSEAASREVLSLPVHPSLTKDDLDCIVKAVASL